MSLRINTNIASLASQQQLNKTGALLSKSIERLSSGLRINRAADDASGMAIADSLKSQSLGLGQAVRNANDGINIVQTADGALEESINIVNTIKTKAIQSAQDGQTTESRKAIQADISKLMEELDTIAKTTSFNGQKLLSGNFMNKKFQVGAYSGETVNISIGSAESTKIGHVSTTDLTLAGEGVTQLSLYSNVQNKSYSLNAIEVKYDNNPEHGLAAVADAINKLSDVLGITAKANVSSTTAGSVAAGTTDASFAINGVNIGEVTVAAGDSTGSLVTAINGKTSQHGVYAAVGSDGALTLTANDGRAIKVTQDANTDAILGGTDMSTLGKIQMTQIGTGAITVSDKNAVVGVTVSTADGSIKVTGAGASTEASVLTAGSVLASGTELGSGTVLQGTFTMTADTTATTKDGTVIAAGSVLASGSLIGSGTTLTGKATVGVDLVTDSTVDDTMLAVGSFLSSGSSFASGTVFDGDVTAFLSGSAAGAVVFRDGQTFISGGGTASVKAGGMTLTAGATVGSGSTIVEDSILTAGSIIHGDDLETKGKMTLDADMSANIGFSALEDSILTTGTKLADGAMTVKGTVTGDMTLTAGSTIADESLIANGSTFSAADTMELMDDEIVGPKDMVLAKDTVIASGSILKAGTVLTVDVYEKSEDSLSGGAFFEKGTTLTRDIVTSGTTTLTEDMTIKSGSMLKEGTILGDGFAAKSENAESVTSGAKSYRLSDVDVTTQEGAQIAMSVADAALKNLDKVRSDLGSVQNQLTSTISNLSVTKINVTAAESSIRDTDFGEESSNFSKMQVLMQAGTFALAQANASSQSVLSLLQ
jgi:flagellin